MDTQSINLHELLSEIMARLDRIETMLNNQQRTRAYSCYSDNSFQESIHSNHTSYVSDDDVPIIQEDDYDSDNDVQLERIELYPEPKLSLTSLQIQLANEEFMQYTKTNNEQ